MSSALTAAQVDGGDGETPITAAAVAALTGGRLVGDPSVVVQTIAPLDRAGPEALSFYAHARYASWFTATAAGVVVVATELAEAAGPSCVRVVVDKPIDAMLPLLARFQRRRPRPIGVHPTAVIAPTASIGDGVTIEPYAVIEDDAVVGPGSWIGPHAVVGMGCTLGRDVRLFAGAVLYPFVECGDRVVLHAGARVGREGFGFLPGPAGITRIPHVGRCVLESDVEIGANSCVDRGSVDDTIIGAGTKLDNLVHIAHNVRVGRMCFFAAQVGIAGSVRIGDGVQFGGQAGSAGHLTVGDRAVIAARGAPASDVPGGETWSGFPARPHRDQLRAQAALARVMRILRPLEQLVAKEPTA